MECRWDSALLQRSEQLPPELLHAIQNGKNDQYLSAITRASLDARFTDLLFAHCGSFFAHTCADLRNHGNFAASIATLGRIIPFAPHLATYASRLLESESYVLNDAENPEENIQYLLGLYRLLAFDYRTFSSHINPTEMTALLGKSNRAVTYLAIRILQIYLSGADNWLEEMIKRYLGPDSPENDASGPWDGRVIDYRFLTLWEEERSEKVKALIIEAQSATQMTSVNVRRLPEDCFNPSTALVGSILLPRSGQPQLESELSTGGLVRSTTVSENLGKISDSLKSQKPLLLTGIAGSGKTLLVRHVAAALGKLDKMVTLHLNEQSDAKLLVGIYTTGDTPGTFLWRPGVLTSAVQEGRWVFIEDLDRAPNDVLGTLLPLIEKRTLLIPNRKQTIHAAQGFRIIASARSTVNHRGEEIRPLAHMIGARHWQNVSISMPGSSEQMEIARQLYPTLGPLLPQFMASYDRLQASRLSTALVGQSKTGVIRALSPRDLLKWCSRVKNLLQNRTSLTSSDVDDMFLEAVDCFVGALPECQARTSMAAIIAEELRVDPQRRDFLLDERDVRYEVTKSKIGVGRYSLQCSQKSNKPVVSQGAFSTNPHTSRMLERVAAAVINREPLLLVGETGVGKTTAVQHLATHLGKKLEAFNLSQQSEAGDLLGGFKPVTARSLIVPMNDEFDDLFRASFSMSKNQQFLELLSKQMAKGNWKAVCKLWHQALKMIDQQRAKSPAREGQAPAKKRKTESTKVPDFVRWDLFADKMADIEKRLAAGSEAFAFSFVEGNIVKALRNGDWILLDEINLASSDTLEAIVDLLDTTSPSILLTEAGNIERIEAHPEFRVFAAMNPATDVGKKDLPPGVRSRFTELYVESPDKDLKSLQSIVQSYLKSEAASDQAVALDVSVLYQKIVGLSHQNRLVDGAGQQPHFSLRTLTRTLSYAKYIAPQCSIRRALFEGFQMSFMTFLDLESAKLVLPFVEQQIFGKKINIRAELKRSLREPSDGHSHVQGFPDSKHWVRQGTLQPEDQSHYILTPFIKKNLENLVRASSTRKFPVLIQGPTSSGKTSMIEYLAKRTGHKFVRINNHEHTDLQEYLGTYVSGADGRLQFQEGILVRALREGHWIVLDELNLAPTDVLEALNRLLDDNRELLIPETQETVRPHESFMLFATQNPAGLYGGRKALSRAFRNRFLELHFDDIPIDELQEILHRRTQLPESRCRRIVTVYRELSVLRQENRVFESKSFATLRDLFRWALRPNDTIEDLAANGFMLLAERVRKPDEREILKGVIEKAMSNKGPRVTIDEAALYSDTAKELQQYRENAQSQGVVWTKAMRRLYVLVSRAIANNEAVLLVGETGCGKTTVCQMLADALSKKLHTVNAHQNTETGDLIGSQRPVRNRAFIEAQLRQELISSSLLEGSAVSESDTMDSLLSSYDAALMSLDDAAKKPHIASSAHLAIQTSRTRFKALFEWSDGSLVQAMKEGSFFLLDEISLADDSVLERINSVLESSRSMLLAEKGTLDSFVTAAPEFQFFATMNPGGDYGKRELSPALRNRFTEIWVPSLSATEDIVQIVEDKLSQQGSAFAPAMVAFAEWFKDQYNTSASSAVSIRDVLAWVQFVNVSSTMDRTAAIVHGAAMVYIDTLGANPAGLMTLTGRSLSDERATCVAKLGELIKENATAIYSADITVQANKKVFQIGAFAAPRAAGTKDLSASFTFDPPTSRSNAMRVMRAMQIPKPVMLEGSPGVGKTALVTAIAGAVGIPLTRINLSEQTDLLDLFGSDVPVEGAATGVFTWRDAPFLRAMKSGEWVLLDEMNLASQSVLEGLNACLDHRGEVFVPELGQTFTRHPNFRVFAAQNPHHQGGGRKGLPASFVNRFTVVYADSFKFDDLMLICQRSYPQVDAKTIEQAVQFVDRLELEVVQRRSFGANGGPWEFNLRDVSRWLSLVASDQGLVKAASARDIVEMLFAQRFRSSFDSDMAVKLMSSVWDDIPSPSDLFSSVSAQSLQLGLGVLPREPLDAQSSRSFPWTPRSSQQLKVLESLMICVQNRWPVILTGSSGAGKTSLIESLAAAVGASLSTMAMNAETDAMDLIGGYEQADTQREATQALIVLRTYAHRTAKMGLLSENSEEAKDFFQCLQEISEDVLPEQRVLDTLAAYLPKTQWVSDLIASIRAGSHSIEKARFDWIDGVLVDALQQGHWLVLDNSNLCSSSVLDRLNSLLEPNGALIINEHTEADGSPRILKPHENFRIFLTADPRYGELSRAMRNRAAELYLQEETTDALCLSPLAQESAMTRFRQVKALCGTGSDDSFSDQMPSILKDHLALCDYSLLPRMAKQLEAGLYEELDPSLRESLANSETIAVPVSGPDSLGRLQELYKSTTRQTQVAADFVYAQTFHPLNNQPLAQLSQHSFLRASGQALIHDTYTALAPIVEAMHNFGTNSTMAKRIQRVEKAVLSKARGSKAVKQNIGIFAMLEFLLNSTLKWTQSLDAKDHELSILSLSVQKLCALYWRLFQAACSNDFNQALFNAWISAARSTFGTLTELDSASLNTLLLPIGEHLVKFESASRSTQGLGCTPMWKALRPAMPLTIEKLDSLLDFEKVVDRFDGFAGQFTLPLQTLGDLRLSFARAMDLAKGGSVDTQELALRLESMMEGATPSEEEEEDEPVASKTAFFERVFETLCQQFATRSLNNARLSPKDIATWEVLAGRQTKRSFAALSSSAPQQRNFQLLSASLPPLTVGKQQESEQPTLSESLFQRIDSVDQATVGGLDLFENESKELGRAIASNAHSLCADEILSLDTCLGEQLLAVLEPLAASRLDATLQTSASKLIEYIHSGKDNKSLKISKAQAGVPWIESQFTVVINYLKTAATLRANRVQEAATAWATFAVVCLTIFLPDEPFDPSLQPRLLKEIHLGSADKLSAKLNDLKAFRKAMAGSENSLRARMADNDLKQLGPEPVIDEVCRPSVSELPQLHSEFESIIRVVQSLQKAGHGPIVLSSQDRNTWTNVENICQRLLTQYRSYSDITGPVVGFVDCLRVAQRLQHQHDVSPSGLDASAKSIVPMGNSSLETWLTDNAFVESLELNNPLSEKLDSLAVIAARCSTRSLKKSSHDLRNAVDREFYRVYQQWKSELTEDQRKTAAKSSLYKYQGDDDLKDDDASEYLEELFPTEDNEEESEDAEPTEASERMKAARKLNAITPKVAALHQGIFNPDSASKSWSGLLQNMTSNTLLKGCRGDLPSIVPKIMFSLRELLKTQSESPNIGRLYNMYTDANHGQARALYNTLNKATKRFEELHTAWPEHATPIEVIRMCNHIRTLGQYEPLTKYLPNVEKLHATVAEWQKIASREVSASEIYEDITTLIVNWRQLELSSWAGLLDREDENCQRDATSWWYVAYENIIVATYDLRDSTEGLQDHADGLLKTLGFFMANCGLGEFAPRLKVLEIFRHHLATYCDDFPSLCKVRDAIANFVTFHGHFSSRVADSLSKSRADLEKEIKNVVQVASWKDRNIDILRQSAKSSHKKLLRLVRKYRRVLAQPVGSIIMNGIPRKETVDIVSATTWTDVPTVDVNDSPLLSKITPWAGRPDRFKNVATTASLMQAKIKRNVSHSDAHLRLSSFAKDLTSSINELQKATPTTLTEKNKNLVQHLKTRKRRLLADILKEVRGMGFQSNLSDDVLAQQNALHTILARSPSLNSSVAVSGIDAADYHFHQLTDLMATVRESARKHSEDLTPAETARCLALLESMLQVSIAQRVKLSQTIHAANDMHATLRSFDAFAECANPVLRHSRDATFETEVHYLATAVETCLQIVQAQSDMSGTSYADALQPLRQFETELSSLEQEIASYLSLPSGVQSEELATRHADFLRMCDELPSMTSTVINVHPELAPTLKQLSDWTPKQATLSQKNGRRSAGPSAWTTELFKSLDGILGTVQKLDEVSVAPSKNEDEKAWLVQRQALLDRQMSTLRLAEVQTSISGLLAELPSLGANDDQTLRAIATACQHMRPIINTFSAANNHIAALQCGLHIETTRVAFNLATSFVQLAQKGFCTPSEKDKSDDQKDGDVEAGTGLGEGEGGEDVSKDIKDDEDLSELAQQQETEERKDDIEDEQDAVDMADAEMEGEMGDENPGSENGDDEGSDGEEQEMDEEAGDVDDLGANTIDEKMWDEGKDDDLRDKETDESKGAQQDQDMAAAEENKEESKEEGGEDQDGDEMAGADETEEVNQQDVEKMDPHVQDQENLDLPDDLNLDGGESVDEHESDIGDISDNEMDRDQPADDTSEQGDLDAEKEEGATNEEGEEEGDEANEDLAEAGPEQDEQGGRDNEDAESDILMGEGEEADKDNAPEDDVVGETGDGPEQDEDRSKPSEPAAQGQDGEMEGEKNEDQPESGTTGGKSKLEGEEQGAQESEEDSRIPYKQIGDALDDWYKQNQTIEDAQQKEETAQKEQQTDVDMADAQFEHLPDNETEADTQALGTASADQSTALDESKGLPVNEKEETEQQPFDEDPEPEAEQENNADTEMANQPPDTSENFQDMPSKAFVGDNKTDNFDHDMDDAVSEVDEENVDEVDEQLLNTHISHEDAPEEISIQDARALWAEHEASTRNSALVLTEHLRLILQPTQATKMRGDFRTGKRLNIKRIIPYIASSYKRDKIWMRRSVPSKRSYQIMLAIDDSKSMAESESRNLAFETLALISKSMSMLEVGELGVVGFGDGVKVAHDFSTPFTSETGAEVFKQFAFSQTKTNVRKLLTESIELFRAARLKATGAASELWQLQLIISDGICEDHPSIRQLVRQAHEERIMMVFIVVDSTAEPAKPDDAPKQSILDLQSAEFAKDANGEMQLKMVKYLDTFPFRYYLIVRDVQELPAVLAGALRQWFSEVVDTAG